MDYIVLAILAMVFLGIHYFLVKQVSAHVSGPTISLLGCLLLLPILFVYISFTDMPFVPEQTVYLGYAFLISLLLGIGVLALYIAIQRGPLSAVMPVYGLNAVIAAVLGVAVLREMVSLERVVGVVFAMVAIILLRK